MTNYNIRWDIVFMDEERISKYEDALAKFGIIPLLLALERYELEEYYEECRIIKHVIDDANIDCVGHPYPTKATYEYKEQVRARIKERTDIDSFNEKIPVYIQELENFIND